MKTSNKSLLYLLVIISVFALFGYILIHPSEQAGALKEIETCMNTEDVKTVWYKYRSDMNGEEDFKEAIRGKLKEFKLKQSEIVEVRKWLPPKTQNLNIILVPDLSNRIKDEKNNPDQIKNDTALLNYIWLQFQKEVRLKMNSKDRLIVDIANPSQGQGQFKIIADSLVFDLSDLKSKNNRFYFNSVAARFDNSINQLYNLVRQRPTGADYVYYFSNILETRVRHSTLEDDYRNIVILLTDGYLEISAGDGHARSISPDSHILGRYCSTGNNSLFQYPAETSSIEYPEVEVYLLEVNERVNGMGCDFRGLKKWWSDWFTAMKIKNASDNFIFRRQQSVSLSKKAVESIFEN